MSEKSGKWVTLVVFGVWRVWGVWSGRGRINSRL